MRIGPFSSFHVDQIVQLLKEKNIAHELLQDEEAIARVHQADVESSPRRNRSGFQSSGEFLYFEVDAKDAEKIYPYLEKYGIVAANSAEASELLESAEYHCLRCDYTSDHAGRCPKHGEDLLEYSEWLKALD